jgi:hypothetical protein
MYRGEQLKSGANPAAGKKKDADTIRIGVCSVVPEISSKLTLQQTQQLIKTRTGCQSINNQQQQHNRRLCVTKRMLPGKHRARPGAESIHPQAPLLNHRGPMILKRAEHHFFWCLFRRFS